MPSSKISEIKGNQFFQAHKQELSSVKFQTRGYGTTELRNGTTNTDAGVGIGMKKGEFEDFTEKAIN